MSDDYIYVIPKDPHFVFDQSSRTNAASFFRSIAPDATEITTSVSDHITFVDCAQNFERIRCPSCGAELDTGAWHQWMDKDFDGNGFAFSQHTMPCCEAQHFLHELRYEWPQGFARSQISAMNPNVGKLTDEQRSRFEQILGCAVQIIYQHI